MDKKSILSFMVIILGIAGLLWWGRSSAPAAGGAPELPSAKSVLTAEETFYDFGKISMKDGNVSKTFRVTNTGSADVKVPSLYTSCMCTNAYILNADGSKKGPFGMPGHGGAVPKANAIVKAGESLDIEVVYDPNAHGPAGVGLIERSVILEDENKNIVEFKFKASVTP